MKLIGDFHIHSHYSRSTSRDLCPETLEYWARIKGINVIGTGDCVHPGWLEELQTKLEPAEEGLFRLRAQYRRVVDWDGFQESENSPRFLLTTEISTIYKCREKVRKVHHLLFVPDFETAEKLQHRLSRIGNISSDGRPILGLSSPDLLEMVLECCGQIFFVPAHIWTPWFSSLGAKSGFDSIEECYGALSGHIQAIEMGLSSDPPMNWLCSFLDRYTLLANSDAHSPEKLGRNANVFQTDLSYPALIEAMKTGRSDQFLGTIDFFPQEGKYHYDGHRKCQICWNPFQTMRHQGMCTVCGKPVTIGVMHRVVQLSDRQAIDRRSMKAAPFYSLIPLKELLAEVYQLGPQSKRVQRLYQTIIGLMGPELHILLDLPLDQLRKSGQHELALAIERMRRGTVYIQEGYDGEYGRITVFKENEIRRLGRQTSLFGPPDQAEEQQLPRHMFPFDLEEYRALFQTLASKNDQSDLASEVHAQREELDFAGALNREQLAAVRYCDGPALILAGPGTGKTRTLTWKIAYLIVEQGISPTAILALTFTNKAAREMKQRLKKLLGRFIQTDQLHVDTFHAFGLQILREYGHLAGRSADFIILTEADKLSLLHEIVPDTQRDLKQIAAMLSFMKQYMKTEHEVLDESLSRVFVEYERLLVRHNAFDIDDLVCQPVKILDVHPDVVFKLRDRFQWILVDEYQDINSIQYTLLKRILSDFNPHVCVIGDVNQSIYGFRGSDPRYIQNFTSDFPTAEHFRLVQSYRCSDTILRAAADVLSLRNSKTKVPLGSELGERVRLVSHKTDRSEAEFIARTIEQMIGGVQFLSMDSQISSGDEAVRIKGLSDFAVLCRTRDQMTVIERALTDHTIPFQSISEMPFYQREPISTLVELARLYNGPDNEILRQRLVRKNIIGCHEVVPPASFDPQDDLGRIMTTLIGNHFSHNGQYEPGQFRDLLDFVNEEHMTWDEFIQLVTYGTGPDTMRFELEHVSIMTLHAAKGLEFECVLIAGCDDGLMPYNLFEEQQCDYNEEKRLFYMGMTRARRYLYLCHADKRLLYGRTFKLNPSPFLSKIQEELLEQVKTSGPTQSEHDETVQLSLFDSLNT
ncbi:UvrD-helicase domain-containing protein [bacterium]|nr:UvrD-helicase domain-containing protein [bacterium]